MSRKITAFVGGHEGFVENWYLDAVHVPTIGFGFTWSSKVFSTWFMAKYGRKFRKGDKISKADALMLLEKLLDTEYGPPVERAFVGRPDHVRAAGKSMIFNCGPGALKWKWALAIASNKITEGCRLWRTTATTAKGKRLPGLVRRRQEEADIAEFNRYPSWVSEQPKGEVATHVIKEDIQQAQTWLTQLGYYTGEIDGITGPKTEAGVKRFQKAHGTLKVDGIIGPATLAALQRAVDLMNKMIKTTAGGGTAAGGGAAVDWSWVNDAVMWGGIAIVVIGLAYLAYRYRDELKIVLKQIRD